MNPRPLFSIITTTYNRVYSGYLAENILSVQSQLHPKRFTYEHIIIDDGSTDNTRQFVKTYIVKDSRIKYIHQKNSGPAKAIKNAIGHARGEFIIILDDDDLLTTDSLSLRAKEIAQNPGIGFLYGRADWIDDYGLPTKALFSSKDGENLYERLLITNCINNGTTTCKTTIMQEIDWPGWLDRSQDYFLWLEMLRPDRGVTHAYIDEVLALYRDHGSSFSAQVDDDAKKNQRRLRNRKIRELHGKQLAFLAGEAHWWVEEAHAANDHRLTQLRDRDARIDELQAALNSFAHSRVVRAVVKLRNVTRGRIFDPLLRLTGKAKVNRIRQPISRPAYFMGEASSDSWPNERPLVSIVTPFYNRADTMPETIRSVLGQTFQDFEYIIVDDGSTDLESRHYLKRIKHEKIRVVSQDNQGVASARNTGIAQARGKYIMCLDSDDLIEITYLEKSVLALEANPKTSIVTFNMQMFGKQNDAFEYDELDPRSLIHDNPLITSAMYRKQVWVDNGGYKSDIGYEDWEFWVSAAEHGHFFMRIPEKLFLYRTAEVSRYIGDLLGHSLHSATIKALHPDFKKLVNQKFRHSAPPAAVKSSQVFNNMQRAHHNPQNNKKRVLIAIPWMTFGGAETLITNYCKRVVDAVDLTFLTSIKAPHEWEYKFQELSKKIYHMPNILPSESYNLDFISYLINQNDIEILHIVHSGYVFDMLKELKQRHPTLVVIVTVFNDRAPYFQQSVNRVQYIDTFTSDNSHVIHEYKKLLPGKTDLRLIPNGVDAQKTFNPLSYDRLVMRSQLGVEDGEVAFVFIGRLSEEKNPDVFVDFAKRMIDTTDTTRFYIIGDGLERHNIENTVSAINSDRLSYLGYKSDVSPYLAACDVFVLPSSIEGFPLSILEAMAMEVIPLASRVGGVPDVITDGIDGFLVAPGSVKELEKAAKKIVNNEVLLKEMKDKARKTVLRKYSTEQLGENYRTLYGIEGKK